MDSELKDKIRVDGDLMACLKEQKILTSALASACAREQALTGVDANQLFSAYLAEARKEQA